MGFRGPVEDIREVGDAEAGGEFAVCFEHFDEGIRLLAAGGRTGGGLLIASSLRCVGLTDLAGRGFALREESGVLVVEVEKGLCYVFAFGLVGFEDGAGGEARFYKVHFPSEVDCVVEGRVHALASFRLETLLVFLDFLL